jgi:hypothetical protein
MAWAARGSGGGEQQPSDQARLEQLGQSLLAELAEGGLALAQPAQAHPGQHLRRLRELDVGVLHDLHVVAPRVVEVEAPAAEYLRARLLEPAAHLVAVVHHEAEVALAVRWLRAAPPMSRKAIPGTRPRSSKSNTRP